MAKPLLLILTLTTLVVAASAASVTVYNPATLPVNIAILAAGDHPRDGADYGDDDVVKPSTTMMTTVNLTAAEQDVWIKSTTGEEHEVEVHVRDGDVLVVVPDAGGDGGLLGFKIDILRHTASLSRVVPPGPR